MDRPSWDYQFRETEAERNSRLRRNRVAKAEQARSDAAIENKQHADIQQASDEK